MTTGHLRDQFLNALDADDREAVLRLASHLGSSTNPLPTEVCAKLGLPRGSTYSAAARKLISSPDLPVPALDPDAGA